MSNYKWNFDPCGPAGRGSGTINPSSKHFKNQTKIQSLVREALQNSLDAACIRYDKNHPVKVSFTFKTIDNINITLPNFLEGLRKHIEGCHAMYPRTSIYQNMLNYLDEQNDSISVLYISDENTKGMYYEKDNPDCTFYGYLKADGAHVDQGHGDGGGSNGIGKMASFNYSKLATVLVSSRYTTNSQNIFQGATILCSHFANNDNGERTLYYGGGFYDCNGGEAVVEKDRIPSSLLRSQDGTDIIIVGVDNKEDAIQREYEEIKKNVLLNFWPAIDNGTLIVQVGDVVIDSKNLGKLLENTFHDRIDLDTNYANPLPYYLAVKGAQGGNEDCRMYGEDDEELGLTKHSTLGHVNLYIMRNKGSKDRIVATRKPLMVIQPFNKRSAYGYSAVVFCDDENGNKYLSNSEGPAHNKWDATGMQDDNSYTVEDYQHSKKAIEELDIYIKECVLNFFASDISDECNIEGLSDLLSSYGKKASKYGTMTTNLKKFMKQKNKVKSTPIEHVIEKGGELSEEENGEEDTLHGGENWDGSENDPEYKKPKQKEDNDQEEDNNNDDDSNGDNNNDKAERRESTSNPDMPAVVGNKSDVRELIDCNPKTMSFKQKGRVVCRLKLNMPKTIEKADIDVYVATADGKLQKKGNDTANVQRLEWAEVNSVEAEIEKNVIKNISLQKGDNIIDFRFPTNNRYRLITEIYSVKK